MGERGAIIYSALDRRAASPDMHVHQSPCVLQCIRARSLCVLWWTNPPFSPRSHTHIKSCTQHHKQDAFQLLFLTRLVTYACTLCNRRVGSDALQHNQMRRNRNSGEIPHDFMHLYCICNGADKLRQSNFSPSE
jgi:hypothetical protein